MEWFRIVIIIIVIFFPPRGSRWRGEDLPLPVILLLPWILFIPLLLQTQSSFFLTVLYSQRQKKYPVKHNVIWKLKNPYKSMSVFKRRRPIHLVILELLTQRVVCMISNTLFFFWWKLFFKKKEQYLESERRFLFLSFLLLFLSSFLPVFLSSFLSFLIKLSMMCW